MLSENMVQELQGCRAERGLNTRQGISQNNGVETGSLGFILFFHTQNGFSQEEGIGFLNPQPFSRQDRTGGSPLGLFTPST
jgi:hypothetical protein